MLGESVIFAEVLQRVSRRKKDERCGECTFTFQKESNSTYFYEHDSVITFARTKSQRKIESIISKELIN